MTVRGMEGQPGVVEVSLEGWRLGWEPQSDPKETPSWDVGLVTLRGWTGRMMIEGRDWFDET